MARTWISRAVATGTEPGAKPPRASSNGRGRIIGSFTVLSLTDLLARQPLDYLVQGIMDQGTFTVLFGKPESGKSFVAFHLALCVATGRPWFGHDVHQGPVLYVAGEGEGGLRQRAEAWCRHWQVDPATVAPFSTSFMIQPINLLQSHEAETLMGIAEDLDKPPVLVVVDTLARCMVGGEENSTKDMGQAVHELGKLQAKIGCATVAVHHNTKGKELVERGSTSLRGSADTMMHVSKSKSAITVTCQKQKNGPHFKPIHVRLLEVDLGEIYTSCVVEHELQEFNAGHSNTLRLLRRHPDGLRYTDIIEARTAKGISRSAAKEQLTMLCHEGLITSPGGVHGGLYKITKSGLMALGQK